MKLQATATNIFHDPYLFVAFGFGTGLSKIAPGTAGTLLAVPIYWLLMKLGTPIYIMVVLISAVVGVKVCDVASDRLGVHDFSGIVWDEIVGLWITMIAVPVSLPLVIAGFFLFRFFDIAKPWPINWLDQQVSGGLGIMADDVLAAVYANLCLQAIIFSGVL